MTTRTRKTTRIPSLDAADVGAYDAILCDLDGCLIAAGRALPGATAFVKAAADRLSIVSNNSADTALTLSRKLSGIGFRLPPERIYLAGELAVRTVAAEHPGGRVLLFAEPPLQALAEELGLRQARGQEADAVILARDTSFTLTRLEEGLRAVEKGAALTLTNPDLFHPGADGRPVPETGALFASFRACLPEITARVIGKPEPLLAEAALRHCGVAASRAVFVGDNGETDGIAAARSGLDFLHLVAGSVRNGAIADAKDLTGERPSALNAITVEAASC